jgi:hypothetical protein
MHFYKAALETANFSFEAYGADQDGAKEALINGLDYHAAQYGLAAGWYCAEDISCRPKHLSTAYRDGEAIPDSPMPLADLPRYQREFASFGELDVVLPEGFTDESWHNDTMPSFARKLWNGYFLRLWIDYLDPSKREVKERPRFSLTLYDQDMEYLRDIDQSDDFETIKASIDSYQPTISQFQFIQNASRMSAEQLIAWHAETVGSPPFEGEAPEFSVLCTDVAEMMFYHAGGEDWNWDSLDAKRLLDFAMTEDATDFIASRLYRCEEQADDGNRGPFDVTLNYFCASHGYNYADRYDVALLRVGQSVRVSDMNRVITVARIQ